MQFEKIERLAALLRRKILGGKLLNIRLSDPNNPHYAKILLQNYHNKRVAAVVCLAAETPENILTYALLWFYALTSRKTRSAEKLWIVSAEAPALARLCGALRPEWQGRVRVFDYDLNEVCGEDVAAKKVRAAKAPTVSEAVRDIAALSPENIRISGRNLTFRGLPFAAFRGEKIWFGIERGRTLLTAANRNELLDLIENLTIYRAPDSPNRSHAFYKMFPEAWLEALLREDISVIDTNLIVAPLHQQFRAESEKIDLLALRRDGRLAIIELKVAPNREHLFQAVDYRHEIERQRLAGNLRGLFGPLPLADEPSLVYLVAPHSAFHPDFRFLAGTVAPEIEVYRFDLNEDWRRKIKILEKQKIQAS